MNEIKIITNVANGLVIGYGATGIARLDIQYNIETMEYNALCVIYKKDFSNQKRFNISGRGEVTINE